MLNCPTLEVAVDASGNLFFADFDYHCDSDRIRKVLTDGIITTVAGTGTPGDSGDGGPAATAQLHGAVGVAIDRAGALYIADRFNNRIRKVALDGIITTVAGIGFGDGGPATRAQLSFAPWGGGMAIDNGGDLYVADTQNFRVRRISPDGMITTFAGSGPPASYPASLGDGGPATQAQLLYPQSIAFDGVGNLFISNREVSPDGIITSSHGYDRALAVDSSDNLYITLFDNNCDELESLVLKTSPAGIETPVAGGCGPSLGDGGPATKAQLGYPFALALDSSGNLYIADIWTNRVRKVSPDGVISTVAGNGTAGFSGDGGSASNAQLNAPVALATDAAGNLFIADSFNNRIRMVSPAGIITTVAGDGTQGYSGDGGPATSAQFGSVSGLAIDRSGNLYIADQLYNAVRLLRPVGSSAKSAK